MIDIERYTPSQMEEEIQDLAEKYVSAVDELETDTEIFEDISEAIQSKTG